MKRQRRECAIRADESRKHLIQEFLLIDPLHIHSSSSSVSQDTEISNIRRKSTGTVNEKQQFVFKQKRVVKRRRSTNDDDHDHHHQTQIGQVNVEEVVDSVKKENHNSSESKLLLTQNDFNNSENVENVEGGEGDNVDEMIANDGNFDGKDAMDDDDDEYNEENDSSEDDYSFSEEEEDEDIKDEEDEEKEDEQQEVSVIRRRVVRRDRSSTRKVQKVGRATKYVQVKKNEQTLTNGQNNADLSKQANGDTEETNNENEQEKDEKLRRSTRRKTVCSKLRFDRYLDGDEDQVTTDQQKYYVADSLSGLRQKIQTRFEAPLTAGHVSNSKGSGVFAKSLITRGSFVCEYSGELITNKQAKQREEKYALAHKGCFMFYFNTSSKIMCIDATDENFCFGHGRLINHRIEPNNNLFPKKVMLDSVPHIVYIAARDIKAGEELCFDYGDRRQETVEAFPWLLN